MLYHAKVFCLLLVAAAPSESIFDIKNRIQKSFDKAVASWTVEIDTLREKSYSNLSEIITKTKKKYDRVNAWGFSNEDERQAVANCFKDFFELCEDRQRRFNATRQNVLRRFEEHRLMAINCAASRKRRCSKTIRTFFCVKKVQSWLEGIYETVESTFSSVIDDVINRKDRLAKDCRKLGKEAQHRSNEDAIRSERILDFSFDEN